ncbi:hypothetical protein KTF22_16575 [Burkholderia multivorans]|uniref:hypothetical protein n=1 Tax=Burkholderia multivorans TaxID=87883 RepID=UPI001C217764|nr:hypothetical protein [Burkholderia multivorans]MBU9663492.1 hypothetical protein [Burkholderia multivorans]
MEWILGTSDLGINGANAKSLVSRCEQSAIGGMVKGCERGRYERRARARPFIVLSSTAAAARPIDRGRRPIGVESRRVVALSSATGVGALLHPARPRDTGRSHGLPTIALCSNPRSAGFAEIEKQRSDAESSAPIDFGATLR